GVFPIAAGGRVWVRSVAVAAHRLPASEPATARAGAGDEDKGPRLAGLSSYATFRGGLNRHAIHPWRADAGRPAGRNDHDSGQGEEDRHPPADGRNRRTVQRGQARGGERGGGGAERRGCRKHSGGGRRRSGEGGPRPGRRSTDSTGPSRRPTARRKPPNAPARKPTTPRN